MIARRKTLDAIFVIRSVFMRVVLAAFVSLWFMGVPLFASECPGNPDALGTSRTLTVNPMDYPRVGSMQYDRTLPLDDHEVVLTFDDGPLSPYTSRVLDILKAQCVQATFFIVGQMADSYPLLLRRIRHDGHSIGTHTQDHPLKSLSMERMKREIDDGIESVGRALGNSLDVAPFFRFPGLIHPVPAEDYLVSKRIMVWSVDLVADDWRRISPDQVLKRALSRLKKRGRGILLLHDIQRRTTLALPRLFAALKAQNYRVVHVVPAASDDPQVTPALTTIKASAP
jgi:peptidoglycan/xylan/chitin deacetylase (PgdA/CDA1 family)